MFLKKMLLLACASLILAACDAGKPQYPAASEALPLTPTLSADGKLLAVLDRSGQETPRLRLKYIAGAGTVMQNGGTSTAGHRIGAFHCGWADDWAAYLALGSPNNFQPVSFTKSA